MPKKTPKFQEQPNVDEGELVISEAVAQYDVVFDTTFIYDLYTQSDIQRGEGLSAVSNKGRI